MVSYIPESNYKVAQYLVLILIVVEDGLVLRIADKFGLKAEVS